MFTGLVEEVGVVRGLERSGEEARLSVRAQRVLEGTRVGDSIAVSGACLTVIDMRADGFVADCMAETLTHTTLGQAKGGTEVNLERSLALGGRLGGHLVLGHVDATAEVLSITQRSRAWELRISLPDEIRGCAAPKGSIAIDGISLTVVEVDANSLTVGIIPHSMDETTLRNVKTGVHVNLEADVLARYVMSAVEALGSRGSLGALRSSGSLGSLGSRQAGGLTEQLLQDQGFA